MNRRKRILILLIASMLLFPACGKKNASDPSGSSAEDTDAVALPGDVVAYDKDGNPIVLGGDASGKTNRPDISMLELPEPVYVYLPKGKDAAKDQIFLGYVPEDEKTQETPNVDYIPDMSKMVAKYQDVSKQNNTIAIPSVYSKAGETATTSLMLCGKVKLCALDLRIQYDPEKLRYVEQETDDDLIIHCDPANGVLYINLVRIVNITDSEKICDLSFEVLSSQSVDSQLQVHVIEAVSLDKNGEIEFCPFSFVDGTVHLNSGQE